MTELDQVLAYIDTKVAAQKKASYVGGLSLKEEHAYAAQVLAALRSDLAAGFHETGVVALDNAGLREWKREVVGTPHP